jgi:hypothetical protein
MTNVYDVLENWIYNNTFEEVNSDDNWLYVDGESLLNEIIRLRESHPLPDIGDQIIFCKRCPHATENSLDIPKNHKKKQKSKKYNRFAEIDII